MFEARSALEGGLLTLLGTRAISELQSRGLTSRVSLNRVLLKVGLDLLSAQGILATRHSYS